MIEVKPVTKDDVLRWLDEYSLDYMRRNPMWLIEGWLVRKDADTLADFLARKINEGSVETKRVYWGRP